MMPFQTHSRKRSRNGGVEDEHFFRERWACWTTCPASYGLVRCKKRLNVVRDVLLHKGLITEL